MESRTISINQTNIGPNISQHYQQHFQQHYAATDREQSLTTSLNKFPQLGESASSMRNSAIDLANEAASSSPIHQPMTSYESHRECINASNFQTSGNARSLAEQKNEKIQTTTTTTTTQPVIVISEAVSDPYLANECVELIHAPICESTYTTGPNTITIEYLTNSKTFDWPSLDIYLHIFLTFYFGYMAGMLFFDGILRSIINLYTLEQSAASPLIYTINIIFSIAYIAFIIWFMTICWRWWRNKSLSPENALAPNYNRSPRDRQATAHKYVFVAACVLIVGFFIFLTVGIVELNHKRNQKSFDLASGYYGQAAYTGDWIIFVFKLVFWIVGIVATLMLSREVLMKYICPSKIIKINKEKPKTIYQIN